MEGQLRAAQFTAHGALTPKGLKPTPQDIKKWEQQISVYPGQWLAAGYLSALGPYNTVQLNTLALILKGEITKKNKVNKPPKLDSKSTRGLDPELAQLQKWIHVCNIFQMVPSEVITKGVCPVTTPGATPRGGQFPLLKMKGPGVLWFTEGTVRDLEDEEEK